MPSFKDGKSILNKITLKRINQTNDTPKKTADSRLINRLMQRRLQQLKVHPIH